MPFNLLDSIVISYKTISVRAIQENFIRDKNSWYITEGSQWQLSKFISSTSTQGTLHIPLPRRVSSLRSNYNNVIQEICNFLDICSYVLPFQHTWLLHRQQKLELHSLTWVISPIVSHLRSPWINSFGCQVNFWKIGYQMTEYVSKILSTLKILIGLILTTNTKT